MNTAVSAFDRARSWIPAFAGMTELAAILFEARLDIVGVGGRTATDLRAERRRSPEGRSQPSFACGTFGAYHAFTCRGPKTRLPPRCPRRENDMSGVKSAHLLLAACGGLALAGCETVAEETTEAVGFEYTAMLAPAAAGGTGSGKVEISLNDATNTLCTDLELSSDVTMTVGHVVGPGGTVVATLDIPKDNDSDDCDQITDAQLDAIKANPGAFKVHVGTTAGDLFGTLVKEG
jgi:hypothetical protein